MSRGHFNLQPNSTTLTDVTLARGPIGLAQNIGYIR